MSADAALILIDSKLGPIYENAVKNRNGDTTLTRFEIKEMNDAIIRETLALQEQRRKLADELNEKSAIAIQTRANFGQKLTLIDNKLSSCLDNSKNLAVSSSQLSVDFAQITDRLDNATSIVCRAKSIAQYIADIKIYNDFKNLKDVLIRLENGDFFPIDDISRSAEYVAKLIKIVSITAKQGCIENAAINLKRHSDQLTAQLGEKILNSTDPLELKDYMRSLMALHPGDDTVNNFINGTPFLASQEGIELHYRDEYLYETPYQQKGRYNAFCEFIATQSKILWPKIDIIFERPTQVKHQLLMKICHLLGIFVDSILRYHVQRSQETYVQMLAYFYERSLQMFEEIWKIELQQFAQSSTYLDAVFMNHQRAYGNYEISILKKFMSSRVDPALEKLERVQKQTTFSNLFKKADEIINPFNVFNDEVPHEVLSAAKEALLRCSLLSPPEQTLSNFQELISIFLDQSFNKYLIAHIKTCSFYLTQNESSQNIEKFIKLITLVNSNVLSLEDAYKNALKAVLQPHSVVHSMFIKMKEQLITILENETVIGLQNCIDLAITTSKKLLSSKQKRQDFTPTNSTNSPSITTACSEFCKFVRQIVNDVQIHMFGENSVSFLIFLGKALIDVLIDHLTQYKYNPAGTSVLMEDATEYQACFTSFEIDSIKAKAMDLVNVVHLMKINTNLLVDGIRGTTLTKSAVKLAKRMLVLRTDAKDIINIESLFPQSPADSSQHS
ncbi:hypothetical protein TRFO_11779 [Tritrichomonas foetus]|uniref:Exocyst complex component Sec10-like alpha-helical bundle domain-containing protein n=1 Tax=Tritrichomonas foetus TaxID=1144522 RepID=A0A1J4J249_9EUKA|nr:hypothetical protein TRFO_11779 [Tritrichomonas foetus]|eukprot:OHS93552.1 hypothetical protein TRFO_11779 [Tritrichomonas foetus]